MECDFCSSHATEWAYPARNFIADVLADPQGIFTAYGTVILSSNGHWAACDQCHALIEAGQRADLAHRSAALFAAAHPEIPAEELASWFHKLHSQFFDNRRGPARPMNHRVEVAAPHWSSSGLAARPGGSDDAACRQSSLLAAGGSAAMTVEEAVRQTVLCGDALEARRMLKVADVIVACEGNDSEKFGIKFGLWPHWAALKAEKLVLTEILEHMILDEPLPCLERLPRSEIVGITEKLLRVNRELDRMGRNP